MTRRTNAGGRTAALLESPLAAIGSLQTAPLMAFFAQGLDPTRVEVEAFPRAALWLSCVYVVGAALIWLIPETKGRLLPE